MHLGECDAVGARLVAYAREDEAVLGRRRRGRRSGRDDPKSAVGRRAVGRRAHVAALVEQHPVTVGRQLLDAPAVGSRFGTSFAVANW